MRSPHADGATERLRPRRAGDLRRQSRGKGNAARAAVDGDPGPEEIAQLGCQRRSGARAGVWDDDGRGLACIEHRGTGDGGVLAQPVLGFGVPCLCWWGGPRDRMQATLRVDRAAAARHQPGAAERGGGGGGILPVAEEDAGIRPAQGDRTFLACRKRRAVRPQHRDPAAGRTVPRHSDHAAFRRRKGLDDRRAQGVLCGCVPCGAEGSVEGEQMCRARPCAALPHALQHGCRRREGRREPGSAPARCRPRHG